jgi:anti-sigma factor ChrR (cupin superfamily)
MKKAMALAIGLVILGALGSAAAAQEKAAPAKKKAAPKAMAAPMNPSDIQWGDAPPILPAGAKFAVLMGDPGKTGPYVVRMKLPDGYKIAAHWHPLDESVTVISGTFNVGMGDKLDMTKGKALTAGAFGTVPARMRHFAWTTGETEVQVHGMGPFKLV